MTLPVQRCRRCRPFQVARRARDAEHLARTVVVQRQRHALHGGQGGVVFELVEDGDREEEPFVVAVQRRRHDDRARVLVVAVYASLPELFHGTAGGVLGRGGGIPRAAARGEGREQQRKGGPPHRRRTGSALLVAPASVELVQPAGASTVRPPQRKNRDGRRARRETLPLRFGARTCTA